MTLAAGSLALHAQDNSRHGRKYKTPPQAAHIAITVVRDYNDKPISLAHVVLHPVEGDRDKGSLEVKTNDDGKAVIDVVPIGDTVRLQVIVSGFQTYGSDFKVDQPEINMEVRMKRPGAQYSIYNNSGDTAGANTPAAPDKGASQPNSDHPQPK